MRLLDKTFWLLSAFFMAVVALDVSVHPWLRSYVLVGAMAAVTHVYSEPRSR